MVLLQAYRSAAFTMLGMLNFTKGGFLNHMKRFKEDDVSVDMTGKNCIVTGANSGIGYETAKSLAARGATVYMVCRNKEKGEDAVSKIKSQTGNSSIHLKICDLSSLQQVAECAKDFDDSKLPLHVLVNNAGLMEHERLITKDGLEMNFAVNVAGTYTITELLMTSLERAAPEARVITVASGGMLTEPLSDDLQFQEGKFSGVSQYARNKRIQVALTEKWARDYKEKGIGFYSMHPGWVETPGVIKSIPEFRNMLGSRLRSLDQGADTILWLAMRPNAELKSGAFYFDRAEAEKHLKFGGTSYSVDEVNSIVERIRSLCKL